MGARRKQQKQSAGMQYRHWLRPLVLIAIVLAGWQLSAHLPEVIMPIDSVEIEGQLAHRCPKSAVAYGVADCRLETPN